MRASQVALGGLGVLGLGFTGYYLSQARDVSKLAAEQEEIEQSLVLERGKARRAESQVLENESLVKGLLQLRDVGKQQLREIDNHLEAARKKVQLLEQQRRDQEDSVGKTDQDIKNAEAKALQLKAAIVKHKDAATLAEQSLRLVQERYLESKQKLNPLNHPIVRDIWKRS